MARFYTVSQTAKILGFSTNSIYKFLDAKRLKSTRGNSKQGRFRIPHSSIEEFLGTSISETAVSQALVKSKSKPKMITIEKVQLNLPSTLPEPTPRHLTKPNLLPALPKVNPEQDSKKSLPLAITRLLILISLTITILEVISSPTMTLMSQVLRLTILSIAILLAYQSGGMKEDHNP